MKVDEEFESDRVIEVETDDEENQAERICENGDDSESDFTCPSRHLSSDCIDCNSPSWPQSYRLSMDRFTSISTPPPVSFLKGSPFLSSPFKRSQPSTPESFLTRPLITATSLDNEELPTSALPVKLSIAYSSRFSLSESPPAQQCSYAQSILNTINVLCGIGILSTPYALKEGGWLSLLILFFLGIITCYTGILLKKCLESSPGLQTYPDIGQAAFGVAGRCLIFESCILGQSEE
ncbi:unnamed protein product [Ilex paraguariensis]|uniref:Amino acid transporter transmembrane domain-containing protein n=1 Tax=Ilex paraguariensis TaxID=185542 RepID=A0ABC8UCG4_9AQUA